MNPLQEITKIQRELNKIANNRTKQEGALEERRLDLKTICGTADPGEAKALLTKLREKGAKVDEQLGEALSNFKEDYVELFEN